MRVDLWISTLIKKEDIIKMDILRKINFEYYDSQGKKWTDGKIALILDDSCKYEDYYIKITAFGGEHMSKLFQIGTQGGLHFLLLISDIDSPFDTYQTPCCKSTDIDANLRAILKNLPHGLRDVVSDIIINQKLLFS